MKILGLDMSTSCGWAVLEDLVLVAKGLINVKEDFNPDRMKQEVEDYQFIDKAKLVADGIAELVLTQRPDAIYIEQTNSGSFRTSQKMLEFIHFEVLSRLREIEYSTKVRYVDTSAWRARHAIYMSKEDKKNNKMVSQGKKRGRITKKHLAVRWANETFSLTLKLKDNDIAEALAIASYGHSKEKLKKPTNINLDALFNNGDSNE